MRPTGVPESSGIVVPAARARQAGAALRAVQAALAAQAQAQAPAQQPSPAMPEASGPGWMLPAILAGSALAVLLVMRK